LTERPRPSAEIVACTSWDSVPHIAPVMAGSGRVTAPLPPDTPRVLRSKSCISSKMPVQLKMRWVCTPGPWLNEPSIDVDCRGPAAKLQVMLSVRPSG
jgi:hypothetical protein